MASGLFLQRCLWGAISCCVAKGDRIGQGLRYRPYEKTASYCLLKITRSSPLFFIKEEEAYRNEVTWPKINGKLLKAVIFRNSFFLVIMWQFTSKDPNFVKYLLYSDTICRMLTES